MKRLAAGLLVAALAMVAATLGARSGEGAARRDPSRTTPQVPSNEPPRTTVRGEEAARPSPDVAPEGARERPGANERPEARKRAIAAVRARIATYVDLYRSGASVEELREAELALDEELYVIEPCDILHLLGRLRAPIGRALVVRHVDRELEHDRERWELALVLAVESAGDDPAALRDLAALASPRVEDPGRAQQIAAYLAKRK